MAELNIAASTQGNAFHELLMANDIQPGDEPSYQLCKLIYEFHPMGGRLVRNPVSIAMSKRRDISIPSGPEALVTDAFNQAWDGLKCDQYIARTVHHSRIYGISTLIVGAKDFATDRPIPPEMMQEAELYFNILDPLNTAGSLVLNQDPNAPDFQKANRVVSNGKAYHPSRSCIVMHEEPIYISFTSSAFGFVGRSIFQRILYPLKSYIQSQITNDLVQVKCGVLIAKLKQPGSIADNLMAKMMGQKRTLIADAAQGNIISIDADEDVTSLNLTNIDTAMTTSRKNIIEDIAAGADTPSKLIMDDGYASVLANGTEDFKATMQHIDGIRTVMKPLYDFMDPIVMRKAWTPAFYKTIQAQFPEEYGSITYNQAFYRWQNDFVAEWPTLQEEPESDKADVEKVKLEAITSVVEKLGAHLDPENLATLIEWAASNMNENKIMFPNPLNLDIEALKAYVPPPPPGMGGGDEAQPQARADSASFNESDHPRAGNGQFGSGGGGGKTKNTQSSLKQWFGNSKVTNSNGEPLKLFHGSDRERDVIEPGYKEPGAWFTTDLQNAANYARGGDAHIHTAFLKAEKPFIADFSNWSGEGSISIDGKEFNDNVDIVKYAQSKGYDSVNFPIGNFSESDNTWVVFNSDQIKIQK